MSVILVYYSGFFQTRRVTRLLFLMSFSSFVLQASALEERLQKTEVELKKSKEEAQKNIQQLNDANSQLVSNVLVLTVSLATWMNWQEQLTWYSV